MRTSFGAFSVQLWSHKQDCTLSTFDKSAAIRVYKLIFLISLSKCKEQSISFTSDGGHYTYPTRGQNPDS